MRIPKASPPSVGTRTTTTSSRAFVWRGRWSGVWRSIPGSAAAGPRARVDIALTGYRLAGVVCRISHTSCDARNAYEQSVFWSKVLDWTEDPDDPNLPAHDECLIMSRDRTQLLLFITVPHA